MSGLTSIIILAWNQLEYTKLCLNSIFRHTSPSYQLILVDNGSTDGTTQFFRTLENNNLTATFRPQNITVIYNQKNLGFPAGVNQGIKKAQGDYLLLLNNDTIVTPNWLKNLLNCLTSCPFIGLVGPRSNFAAVTGLDGLVLNNPEEIEVFARQFNQPDPDKWFPVEWLPGFCLLIKKQALDTIGLLDEKFEYGFMEDVDLGRRANQAGFVNMCAGDTFVYHFGSRTFTGNGLNIGRIWEENEAKLQGLE
ncbi:MAG: glycosyltransferase family 2 protein [Thermincolia bacterium]